MASVQVHAPLQLTVMGGAPVERAFPQPGLASVGPWVVADGFGPAVGLAVPEHPVVGVQALTWLFAGRLVHTDGLGNRLVYGPGQVVMTTAGAGVPIGQASVGDVPVAGVALRLALPPGQQGRDPSVEEFWPEPVRVGDHEVAILVGSFGFEDSPVEVFTDALAAEVRFASGEPLDLPDEEEWDFAVLAGAEALDVGGSSVPPGHWARVRGGGVAVRADASAGRVARALVLGGPPLA